MNPQVSLDLLAQGRDDLPLHRLLEKAAEAADRARRDVPLLLRLLQKPPSVSHRRHQPMDLVDVLPVGTEVSKEQREQPSAPQEERTVRRLPNHLLQTPQDLQLPQLQTHLVHVSLPDLLLRQQVPCQVHHRPPLPRVGASEVVAHGRHQRRHVHLGLLYLPSSLPRRGDLRLQVLADRVQDVQHAQLQETLDVDEVGSDEKALPVVGLLQRLEEQEALHQRLQARLPDRRPRPQMPAQRQLAHVSQLRGEQDSLYQEVCAGTEDFGEADPRGEAGLHPDHPGRDFELQTLQLLQESFLLLQEQRPGLLQLLLPGLGRRKREGVVEEVGDDEERAAEEDDERHLARQADDGLVRLAVQLPPPVDLRKQRKQPYHSHEPLAVVGLGGVSDVGGEVDEERANGASDLLQHRLVGSDLSLPLLVVPRQVLHPAAPQHRAVEHVRLQPHHCHEHLGDPLRPHPKHLRLQRSALQHALVLRPVVLQLLVAAHQPVQRDQHAEEFSQLGEKGVQARPLEARLVQGVLLVGVQTRKLRQRVGHHGVTASGEVAKIFEEGDEGRYLLDFSSFGQRRVVKPLPVAGERAEESLLCHVHQPRTLLCHGREDDEDFGDVLAVCLYQRRDVTVLMSSQLDAHDVLVGIPNIRG
mmetsp:Transcript_15399/g.51688  ORF Transcript_15399/g.51688 Transcript_15399/m.51688 type:complete len:641 (-) Transcript_15399:179-2101(-)